MRWKIIFYFGKRMCDEAQRGEEGIVSLTLPHPTENLYCRLTFLHVHDT